MKRTLLKEMNSLPSLPNCVFELENFRKIDSTNTEELIKIISKDPLIVANILKVANSSMFSFKTKIDTLSRAINLLGIKFTISIAIGFAIQQSTKSNLLAYAVNSDDFIFSASLASNIVNTWVSKIDFDLKNELLLPAFLQEIGKFVISQVIQEERLTEEFLKELEETKDISYCEEKFTGFTCARITANIFKNWHLSHNIIFPIAFAEDIENCPPIFKQKAQILQIIKILCDIRYPLSDFNIDKALNKVVMYNFDVEDFLNSIDVIKGVVEQNS